MFILPVNRDLDSDSRPYALISILAINTVVLVAMYVFGNSAQIYREYGFTPGHPHLLNLLTSMFMHAGFWHLVGSAWFLWMFGKEVENSVGPALFVLIYLACGFGGGLLHYAFNTTSLVPCVGASGAISGIAGFFFILSLGLTSTWSSTLDGFALVGSNRIRLPRLGHGLVNKRSSACSAKRGIFHPLRSGHMSEDLQPASWSPFVSRL